MILVINKVDRPDARVAEVVDEVYELFLDLDADEQQIDFPIVYCNAKAGVASLQYDPGRPIEEQDLAPLLDLLLERIPAPLYDPEHPLQALVTNLDASPYVGRLALCRVRHGNIKKGQQIAWCRADGTIQKAPVAELYVTDALERVDAEEAGPGEIIAVAGIAEVTIGETLADPDDPRPLPVITVDEPAMSITIGANTSPLAGKDGSKLDRPSDRGALDSRSSSANVSLRVHETAGAGGESKSFEVQGRGELQLAVLVEIMRREGFELTVGQPHVVEQTIDGKRHEPVERLVRGRARGARRHRHAAAGREERPDGAHDQPRHRLGAAGLPRARAWADRLPHGVPHGDARDRDHAPCVRPLGAVGGRAADAPERRVGGRPPRRRR